MKGEIINPPSVGITFLYLWMWYTEYYPADNIRKREQTTTTTAIRTAHDMCKIIATRVRYKSLNNSLPSYTKQQREITKFYVV